MTASSSNPVLPRGITEADVIDLVDGVLPRSREGEVLAALKAHPQLGLLAKQLRADRALIGELPEVRAPRGLGEGIESRLQAAVLRDLAAQSEEVARPIPISSVQMREPSVLRRFVESPWSRRLAVAASLAIIAGLGAFVLRSALQTPAPKVIAVNPAPPTPANESPAPTPAPTTEVAVTTPEHGRPSAPTLPAPVVAVATPNANEPTPATLARLAAEGRLAITIRTVAAASAAKRLDSIAKGRDTGWHAIPLDAPTQYAALLAPLPDAALPATFPHAPDPIAIAGDSTHPSTVAPAPTTHPAPALPAPRPVVRALYTVELTPGEQPLSALMRSISDTLPDGSRVSYRILPQPIVAPISFDPDAVLWWTSPAAKWSKHANIPVVIEGLE